MSGFQRNLLLDELIKEQAKLATESDPKKIEELKEKIELLEKMYKFSQVACY